MAAKRRDKVKSELDLLGLDVLATETGLIGQVVGGRRGKHCRGAPTASQPMIDPRPCPGGCILRLGVREPFRHAPNHTVDALAVDHDIDGPPTRSEEHTSELQSLMRISYAVCCLKKKKQQHDHA